LRWLVLFAVALPAVLAEEPAEEPDDRLVRAVVELWSEVLSLPDLAAEEVAVDEVEDSPAAGAL